MSSDVAAEGPADAAALATASIEGQAAASDEPVVEPADPEARYRYDESLLIKVKGKVKKPQPPNEAEKKILTQKLQEEIDKRSERIKAIKQAQEDARNSRTTPSQPLQRLQALRQQFSTVLRQKQRLREEQQQASQERDTLRNELRALKDRLPRRVGPDGGDAELKELEFRLAHESNQPAEEKVMQARVKELTAARPALRELAQLEAKVKERNEARDAMSSQLQTLNTQLDSINGALEAEKQSLEALKSSQNLPDQNSMNEEKKECWDLIQVLRKKKNEVNADFNQKYQEYIKLDKNYNNYMRSVKRKEYLERQKAREEREAAQAAEATGTTVDGQSAPSSSTDAPPLQPYAGDLLTLDQLLTCLRKLVPTDDKAGMQQGEKKAVEVPAGMKPMKKKDDEADFFTVSKKKPQQGKKGGATQEVAAPAAKSSEPAKKKLYHPLETLKTFMQYSIEVPQWSTELAATIQKVEAKKEYFVIKGQKEKEARANGTYLAPEKASAPSSSSNGDASSSPAVAAEPESAPETSGKDGEDKLEAQANGSADGGQQAQQQAEEPAANGSAVDSHEEPSSQKAVKKKHEVDLTLRVDTASQLVTVEMVC